MPKRIPLKTSHYYHVFNRGVAKQEIYLEDFDYARFVESLEAFNTPSDVTIQNYRGRLEHGNRVPNPLVKIHAFTLLPNHYHFILQQLVDNGIKDFMTKLNGGYSRYFNIKYERVGPLFQNSYRANWLETEYSIIRATSYVHKNILDLDFPEWRDGGVIPKNKNKAIKALGEYPWSDCRDWAKKDNSYLDFLIE